MAFDGADDSLISSLLRTREVQRLRRVRQLGFTSFAFPGAEHSRFAHAVGAAYVMVRLQQRIRARETDLPPDARMDHQAAHDALSAALLHDLGHGPFSHLFEDAMPGARHHETWTAELISDSGTEVHQALERSSRGRAERVVDLLAGRAPLGYLSRAVSGVLDVDRADYLLRDSHMTGVRYGLYDLDWLLQAFSFGNIDGEWVLAVEGRKGLPPVEAFFLGRNFMYQQVYHHKTTRAAEVLIRALFRRVTHMVRDGRPPEATPPAMRLAARGDTVSVGAYLDLDDAVMLNAFAAWSRAADSALSELARRAQNRGLPKTIALPRDQKHLWSKALHAAQSAVGVDSTTLSTDPPLGVELDVATDVPFVEPEGRSPEGLWVLLRDLPARRLGGESFLLGELRNKEIARPRLIFPGEWREPVARAVRQVFA